MSSGSEAELQEWNVLFRSRDWLARSWNSCIRIASNHIGHTDTVADIVEEFTKVSIASIFLLATPVNVSYSIIIFRRAKNIFLNLPSGSLLLISHIDYISICNNV